MMPADLFTDETLTVDGKVFKVPRCPACTKPMQAAYDTIAKKITGYEWECKCKCPDMKDVRIGIG